MIVDCINDIHGIIQYVTNKRALVIPIFVNPHDHVACNELCAIYIYTEDDIERLIPIRHTEQITGLWRQGWLIR